MYILVLQRRAVASGAAEGIPTKKSKIKEEMIYCVMMLIPRSWFILLSDSLRVLVCCETALLL